MFNLSLFWQNILYALRCLSAKNPKNPNAPRLWDLKPGTKLEIISGNGASEFYTIEKIYFELAKFDSKRPKFKATVIDKFGKKDNIYLSDAGVVPYFTGWLNDHVPYLN